MRCKRSYEKVRLKSKRFSLWQTTNLSTASRLKSIVASERKRGQGTAGLKQNGLKTFEACARIHWIFNRRVDATALTLPVFTSQGKRGLTK